MSFPAADNVLMIAPAVSTSPGETHAALVVSLNQFEDDVVFAGSLCTDEQLRVGSQPNAWETAWLVWNYTDNDHFYYFTLKTNGWELGKRDPSGAGGQKFLATGDSTTVDIGAWQDFRIEQHGATITVTVGGHLIVSYTDTDNPYTAGAIGVYSEDARVYLDDVSGSFTDTFDSYPQQSLADGSTIGSAWNVAFLGYGQGGIMAEPTAGIVAIGGNRSNDILTGGAGDDSLSGLGGNDVLSGGAGADTLDGGRGTIDLATYINDGPVRIDLDDGSQNNGAASGDIYIGIEEWEGSSSDDTLSGSSGGADRLFGGGGNDLVKGRGGNDVLSGNAGNDTLGGGDGNDQIYGGDGDDRLGGDGGRDTMLGGAGADTFVYLNIGDSGYGSKSRDLIKDFVSGDDKLDLSGIDADGGATAADDAFTFSGSRFSGAGSEVRIVATATSTYVELDIDGDRSADMQIQLYGTLQVTVGDLIL